MWRDLREGGEEREVLISYLLYVPQPGIEPTTLVYEDDTNQLSYLARAAFLLFLCNADVLHCGIMASDLYY